MEHSDFDKVRASVQQQCGSRVMIQLDRGRNKVDEMCIRDRGMTKSQIFFRVTLLQMIKRIVPPMSNEIITLVKDTSLARIIALQEIIWAGQAFMKGSQGISGAIWPMFFTAVYYLIWNGILTVLLGRLEKKLDYFR